MTPIFEGQPAQNKAFSNQNRGHLGSRYIYVWLHLYHYKFPNLAFFTRPPFQHTMASLFEGTRIGPWDSEGLHMMESGISLPNVADVAHIEGGTPPEN